MRVQGNRCCRETACASRHRPIRPRGRGIVDDRHAAGDGFGEDALSLQQRRHRRDHRAANRLTLALVVDEEEGAVPSHRAADDAAELVAAERAASPGWSTAKKFRAFSASCRKNSKTLPCNALPPDFVVRLTTPPLKRPNSAGGLLVST